MTKQPQSRRTYGGIDQDQFGGMTPTGAIIKDAWIFGLIPETERCSGWDVNRMQILYDQTTEQWAQYNYRANNLPPELRARHDRIHREAMIRARELGWLPDALIDEEEP